MVSAKFQELKFSKKNDLGLIKFMKKIMSLIYFGLSIAFSLYSFKSLKEFGPEPVLVLIIIGVAWIMSFLILTILYDDKK